MLMTRMLFLLLVTVFLACEKEEMPDYSDCDSQGLAEIIIDSTIFNNVISDDFTLDSIYVENDKIVFEVRYGGGCGFAGLQLISNGQEQLSTPPGVELKPLFIDKDLCEALISRAFCFDLKSLDFLSPSDEVLVTVDGWGEQLVWKR